MDYEPLEKYHAKLRDRTIRVVENIQQNGPPVSLGKLEEHSGPEPGWTLGIGDISIEGLMALSSCRGEEDGKASFELRARLDHTVLVMIDPTQYVTGDWVELSNKHHMQRRYDYFVALSMNNDLAARANSLAQPNSLTSTALKQDLSQLNALD